MVSKLRIITARNIADASTYAKGSLNSGQVTDRQEEARLDKAMKDMFEFDHTRMLLLYRLPTEAVVSTKRPDWGRLIRNKPEFPNSGCVNLCKPCMTEIYLQL